MTGYRPPIIMANSLDGTGADEVLEAIKSHAEFLHSSGKIAIRRKERLVMEIQNRIELLIGSTASVTLESELGASFVTKVLDRKISPAEAAKSIVASITASE